MRRSAAVLSICALAVAAVVLPGAADAHGGVTIRVDTPELGIRIGAPPPVLYPAPIYPAPIYAPPPRVIYPAPVYVPPPRVYLPPPRVIYPAPVIYGRPYVYAPYGYVPVRHGKGRHKHRHWRDHDDD
jgi:hypothetical protein